MQDVPQGTAQLWAVSFSDRLHGWAAGRGVILGTSDGGDSWTTQYTRDLVDFMSLDCVDATHAWATAQTLMDIGGVPVSDSRGSVVIVNTSNGSTWSGQATDATGYVYGLDFVDTSHGWIMTGCFDPMEGVVLATTDGGATWVKQHLGVFSKPFDLFFLNQKEGWALGYESDLLFHTTDGGSTWQSWKSGGLRCISFTDPLHGFAAGLRFNDDFTVKDSGLYCTVDGGHSWTLDCARPRGESINRMDFGAAGHGAAVGSQYASSDPDTGVANCTWSILRYVGTPCVPSAPTLAKLSPTRGKVGIAVTLTGTGFGAKRGTSKVLFGARAVTKYLSWSATKIKVRVPTLTKGKKAIKVKTASGTSNVKYFTRIDEHALGRRGEPGRATWGTSRTRGGAGRRRCNAPPPGAPVQTKLRPRGSLPPAGCSCSTGRCCRRPSRSSRCRPSASSRRSMRLRRRG